MLRPTRRGADAMGKTYPQQATVFSLQKRPILILKTVAYLSFLSLKIDHFCKLNSRHRGPVNAFLGLDKLIRDVAYKWAWDINAYNVEFTEYWFHYAQYYRIRPCIHLYWVTWLGYTQLGPGIEQKSRPFTQ